MSQAFKTMYEMLTDRNRGFITAEEQQKVKNCHVAVFGLGAGAVIAKLMVRTGFNRLTIADNGLIEGTNLNRQPWTTGDVRSPKVHTLETKLREISHCVQIKKYIMGLNPDNINSILVSADRAQKIDIIVNAIGIEALPMTVQLHQWAQALKIPVIEPVNAGWCGGLFVFGEGSPDFEEMIGLEGGVDPEALATDPAKMLPYWDMLVREHMPHHMREPMMEYLERVGQEGYCALPQLGAGVYLTASLVVQTLVRLVCERPVKLAPQMIFTDAVEAVAP